MHPVDRKKKHGSLLSSSVSAGDTMLLLVYQCFHQTSISGKTKTCLTLSLQSLDSSYIGLLHFWSFGWEMMGGIPPVPIFDTSQQSTKIYCCDTVIPSKWCPRISSNYPPKLIELAAKPLHIVHHVPDHPCKAYMFMSLWLQLEYVFMIHWYI